MNDFTFLTDEQIFGNDQLDILKKYGTKCAITDFSILLGGYAALDLYTSEGYSGKNRTGWWWSKTPQGKEVCIASIYGTKDSESVNERFVGSRPALSYLSISSICTNVARVNNGILEAEYGEYPQNVVSREINRTLENEYSNGTIKQTGKTYTTDTVAHYHTDKKFQAGSHIEYEYNGRKYIRIIINTKQNKDTLSDGRTIQSGTPYWIEVEPIKWLIDEKTNIALSKRIIFSGVQFNRRSNYKGDFDKTDIKKFMDTYFSKDITPSLTREVIEEKTKRNSYSFNFERSSEETIERELVNSNDVTMEYNQLSDSKSERIGKRR